MSYMGIKGICLDLEKRGLLDTWRQPQKIGRPHMLYRLTQRAHDLFPTASNAMTIEALEAARKLFGATAPEKLLLVVFQQKAEQYLGETQRRDAGRTREMAGPLARSRRAHGGVRDRRPPATVRIVEHHSPILDVLRAFPIVARLETDLFQRLLGVPVQREETNASGLFCATFRLP